MPPENSVPPLGYYFSVSPNRLFFIYIYKKPHTQGDDRCPPQKAKKKIWKRLRRTPHTKSQKKGEGGGKRGEGSEGRV